MPEATPPRPCVECGHPIPAGSRRDRKYCSKQCSRVLSRRNEESTFSCQRCGATSRSRKKRPRFCRPCAARSAAEVAAQAHAARARDRRMPALHPNPTPRHEVPAVHPAISGRLFVAGPCAWCGGAYTGLAWSWESRSLYCSERCANGCKVARRGKFSPSPKQRLRIYERDNWTCQLCDEPVDRDAHYLDDWAPTLDHIIPQSHVLVPDHSDSNLRLAHRWCNAVRGDETHYTAADLAS